MKILKHRQRCGSFICKQTKKKKKHVWRLLRLKASNKDKPEVFTSSTALRKVSPINLQVKMLEERYK